MRRLAALIACVAFAGPALAEAPLDGHWVLWFTDCGSKGPFPITFEGKKVTLDDAHCTMVKQTQIASGELFSWRVQMACSGNNGDQFVRETVMAIDFDPTGFAHELIEIDLGTGHTLVRKPCGPP